MASTPFAEGTTRFVNDLSARLVPFGFVHAKKMLWVRVGNASVHFIHLHRDGSTYGAPAGGSLAFRLHLGARMPDDVSPALHLNGPVSNDAAYLSARYHLRFNAKTLSMYDRTLDDAVRFVREVGSPWFSRSGDAEAGASLAAFSAESRKLLGLASTAGVVVDVALPGAEDFVE